MDNVETLRRYHELLNSTGQLPLELVHPDIEVIMFRGSPISGPYQGHDGLKQWQRDAFDVIDSWQLELDEVITGDDPDVMVARMRFVGRMRHTDLAANFPLAGIVRFRDGLIVLFQGFRDMDEALEVAGLGKKSG